MTQQKNNKTIKRLTSVFYPSVLALAIAGCSEGKSPEPIDQAQATPEPTKLHDVTRWPELNIKVKKDPVIEQKVQELLAKMTLEQKIGQMIQPEIRDFTVEDMRKYGFGSYLNGGGAFPNNDKHALATDWIAYAEKMYQASIDDSIDGINIPTMWGTDAVHGHNNVIGATLFPHNIGLGATNNPELIGEIAEATAREVMATGIDWVFAPTVAVVRDDRWGRTYEGYSENPDITYAYSAAIVEGLQGAVDDGFLGNDRVISTIKHFVGDGGTEKGDDQGNNLSSEEDLIRIHAQGYLSGLEAGAQTVMASFNSWHGEKMHGNRYMLTEVLKERMGFDGLIVGDWNGHGQVTGCSNASCAQAVNAGMDILMAATPTWKPLLENTIAQVKSGEIPMSRIDDAVTRILRVKFRAGLFDKPSPANRALAGKTELIGAAEHRAIARKAVRESLVLLKNQDNLLPLSPKQKIFVTGDAADNIGKQSGGWSITWQGTNNENADFPGASSIYQGFESAVKAAGGKIELGSDANFKEKPDVAIVVFGEEPYAEGNGDIENLEYQRGSKTDLALLKELQAQGIPVVSVFISGRPLWVNPELNASNAFVAAWLPGTEGAGVADVLLTNETGETNFDFTGKLSYSWPQQTDQSVSNIGDANYDPLLPFGFGLAYGDENLLASDLSEEKAAIDPNAVLTRPIFSQGVKQPWHIETIVGKGENAVSTAMSNSTLDVGAFKLRTMDRNIQEDAILLEWQGSAEAAFSITAEFPDDLRSFTENKAALVFDIQKYSDSIDSMFVSMNCAGACEGKIKIDELLKDLPKNEWKNIAIDLACFTQAGTNMENVNSPFTLSSDKANSLAISEVWFTTKLENALSLDCSSEPATE